MDRPPRQLRLVGAAVALALLTPTPLLADLVVLRNGQELRGRVRAQGDRVHIDLDIGGTVTVARGDIARTVVDAPEKTAAQEARVPPELMARLEERERIHLLIAALADPQETRRLQAERQLVEAGRAALPLLRPALDAGPTVQRLHLLRVLAAIGDPAILPQTRGILADAQQGPLHAQAARTLAETGGPQVAPELTAVLLATKDDEVAAVCLKALVAARAPVAAPFVLEALQRPALRPIAAAAIPRWGDPVMLPYLLSLLERARSEEGRERLAGWAASLMTPGHAATLSQLLEAHKDEKELAKALFAGVQRLHRDFPVAGDVALLAASQEEIRKAAHQALQRRCRADHPPNPKAWQEELAKATRPRLLVVAVGRVSPAAARDLAAALAQSADLTAEAERTAVPFPGPDAEPRDARRLLAALDHLQRQDPRSLRVIGLAAEAIAAPGYARAMAPTRPRGAVCVSLAGLGTGRSRTERALRLTLHALARSFVLPPCTTPGCPSGPVYRPRDLDAKHHRFCPTCAKAFEQRWAAEAPAAGFRYAEAGRALSRLADKSSEGHAQAAYMFERALDHDAALKEWEACHKLEKRAEIQDLIQRRIERLTRAAGRGRKPAAKK